MSARRAVASDVGVITDLYRDLLDEMKALKPVWALTDGLAEPLGKTVPSLIASKDGVLIVGEIDEVPLGFLNGKVVPLLPQAGGEAIGVVEHIFTLTEAREVGVGEAMLEAFVAAVSPFGVRRFDAVAPPGHREAKNFFESHGFAARRIVMHRPAR